MNPEPNNTDDGSGEPMGTAEEAEETSDTGGATTETRFVWCAAPTTEETPTEPGFEWGGAVDDPTAQGDKEGNASTEETADTEASGSRTLDPALVTRARGRGIDEEAVTRLAAFRHNRSSRQRDRDESATE